MMLTAVMSTGSAEIIAVASIIIYDIYIPYVKPFRKNAKPGHCLLCDKPLRLSIIVYNQRPLPLSLLANYFLFGPFHSGCPIILV